MTQTIRYPQETAPESSLIITVLNAVGTIDKAGNTSVDFSLLKTAGARPGESPFISLVIEFTANAPVTFGNGTTESIGLYGLITHPTGPMTKYLLGILGFQFPGKTSPQIVCDIDGSGLITGQAQIIQAETVYDRIAVGCVQNAVPLGGPLVTCKIRPFFLRDYGG